ncbi:MAG: M20/M25/M40 family metallo-hydrolase [Anaerolineae bacterium]|nr:M20/M25/M40 family metallo-hydrolase [Anaerolineae bacterium]
MDDNLQELMAAVEAAEDELVDLHRRLVRIPSINTGAPDSGNETAVCQVLEEVFAREGIASTTLESAPTRGNIVAHIGTGNGPRLLTMNHTDVVPVDESRWSVPPFAAEVRDGKVYGRGTSDCKSLTSSGALSMILLKRLGISLKGTYRFVGAADEESGGKYGIAWLAEHHPDTIRADYAVNEGGGAPLTGAEGVVLSLAVGEKGRMVARYRFDGRSGHAAVPWHADNTLYSLAQLLTRLENYQPELDVSLPFFQSLHLFGVEDVVDAGELARVLSGMAEDNHRLAGMMRGLSRITITPTMTAAGLKSNSIPAFAELTCDIRTLPHQDAAYVKRELHNLAEGIEGVSVDLEVTAATNASPHDTAFVEQLRQASAAALGREDISLLPVLTIGFTDARCVRPLGTDVYGFSPSMPDEKVNSGVHGVDEVISIADLVLRAKMQTALAFLTLAEQ